MNILYISPFYKPAIGFGGPTVVSHVISKAMVKKKHKATVLTTDAYTSKKRVELKEEDIDGVRVLRFRNVSTFLAKNFNIFMPIGLRRYIKKNIKDFNIVHIHSFFTYLNIVTVSVCKKYKIPYILHLHESPLPIKVLRKVTVKKMFNYFFGKNILTNASRVVVVSKREKDILLKSIPELNDVVVVVPNTIENNLPILPAAKRSSYGLSNNDKVIVSLSRLGRIKRIDTAIRSLRRLVDIDPSYKLIIAGQDESGTEQSLRKLAKNLSLGKHVKFIGGVGSEDRAKLFSIADLYLLMSEYESFSVSTLEALHYNVPVCLSKEVGVSADITPYKCGVLFNDIDDALEVSNKIVWAYNNKLELSKNCATALKPFLNLDVGAVFENMYKQVINI